MSTLDAPRPASVLRQVWDLRFAVAALCVVVVAAVATVATG